MAYLLDTHVVLWALDEQNRLSNKSKAIISDPNSSCFVSVISFFEIAIKKKIGKLELSNSVSEYILELERIGIIILPISNAALDNYETIPLMVGHGDPFDRFILATALSENLTVISADEKFQGYKKIVEVLW
ncbi:type II toxin-antitoxin system VapC family toxin [Dyadobacter chenwenxiniae]|uniref:Type II toxin-antitoxin system VapC family toxin n=1 Tax=Dyadobacter chenwenxiniae TaxID=2906456 RepID=A0A9X1TH19_9BACT|nr:type II toxin-antitoxin system VapC family toxin [Dyadobacter chenwenxiniae]MCF0064270.1 type II toxin-antitoxin system VapC family toxin [Dyadobacter chenwenxiniae]UON82517.1 type II toxin-antitoxin system VapC family toxin [Dyadobacter chenwenxiniae]